MSIEIWVPILTTILGAVATLITMRYRHKLELERQEAEEQENCQVKKHIEQDEEVIAKLERLRELAAADRASIYQFHNGGEYFTGKSMQKVSMTYEVVNAGISRLFPERQAVPVSACNSTLLPLIKDRRTIYLDVSKDMPESLCKFYAMDAGTKSMYKWTIYNLDKKAIGYFQLDYVNRKRDLNQDTLQDLEMAAIKLAGYL
jgi:hypothetical protein